MARVPIGLKIKKQRKELGMTQAQLAEKVDISPSYLNLIENNKRPIAGKLLQRISQELGMGAGALDGESDRRLISELSEMTGDPLFQNMDLTHETAPSLVGQNPRWARALRVLYRAYLDQGQTIKALTDRLNYAPYVDDAVFKMLTHATAIKSSSEILQSAQDIPQENQLRFLDVLSEDSENLAQTANDLNRFMDSVKVETRSLTPADEVDDYLQEQGGYFENLEQAAQDLIRQVDGLQRSDKESRLQDYLMDKFNVRIQFSSDVVRSFSNRQHHSVYHPLTQTLEMPNYASAQIRRYEMSCLLVELALKDVIEEQIRQSDLLSSPASKELAAIEIIDYLACCLLMPYDRFYSDAMNERYDVDVLSRKYTVGFQLAASRLVSLKRKGASGIPFGMIQTNTAGHLMKRMTLPGLPIPRYGSACPLWDIYTSFQTPGRLIRQLVQFPNREKFLFFAKAETTDITGFSQPRMLRGTMLACDLKYADQTVYGDGLDMRAQQMLTKVGVNCRLCSWVDCIHREEAPMMQT
jgi:predicted transcriptional regulator/transcriptional regulator with XRE-family HTH domain